MDLKIGDTLYRFDGNRRVYGNGTGAPIYCEHFEPLKIIGETKVSWILEREWRANKKTLSSAPARQYGGRGFFTAGQMEDDIWKHDHAHKIRALLERAPPDQLRKVAEILGYIPSEV